MFKKSYEIGYKRPPKSSQWKKGQSGNPSGKKKKASEPPEAILTCLAKQLSAPVTATLEGEEMTIPFGKAFVLSLRNDLIKASFSEKLKALALFQNLGVLHLHQCIAEEEGADDSVQFTEEDKLLLAIASAEIAASSAPSGSN